MSTCLTCSKEGTPGAVFCGSCGSRLPPDPLGDETVDLLLGQTLNGTYFIEQKIGSGGMGDVYRAIHKKLESPVALKIVKPGLLAHSTMVHRFQREARAASKLHHPNIVSVTDFGQCENGMLFMVMEYVRGKSLARVIADDAPLPEPRVVHIGAQILSALGEAHANHILHRDLKPENVMIEARRDAPDSVKVLDFGIAKMLAAGAGSSTLTQAGLVCGTPGYVSPEQLRGNDADPRSDLFSLGVVLYEMLTHKLPFDARATPMEMLHKQLSEPVPPPSLVRGRPVSPVLERLVMQALSPSREDRPASAEAMRAELLGLDPPVRQVGHDTEEGFTTEVLPPKDSSRSVPVPSRATPLRSERTPGAPTPSSARPELAEEQRKTLRTERTRSRPGVARRESRAGTASSAQTPTFEKRVEDRVARLLGPVAPHLVRKASAEAATPHDLCQHVAAFIPSVDDRKAFLAWASAELNASMAGRQRPATAATAPRPAVAWDPAVLDRARRDLAVHLGPLAAVVVRKVSPRARDRHELYELLAREIPSEADREAFKRLAPPDAPDA